MSAMVVPLSTSRAVRQACFESVAKLAGACKRASVGHGVETFDKIEIVLGLSDDFTDRDVLQGLGEAKAAIAASDIKATRAARPSRGVKYRNENIDLPMGHF
jgi:hypothetical protein